MDEEIHLLKEKVTQLSEVKYEKLTIYTGNHANKEIVFVKSGIGKVNAAVAATILITVFKAKVIINTGIAGSLSHEASLGDIVISNDTIQYDFDVTAFGYAEGHIPRMEISTFEADQTLIDLCVLSAEEQHTIHVGRIVSGDRFVNTESFKQHLRETFKALCVDMESAAIGHVCYLHNLPYVAIRCISDNADETSNTKYKDFERYTATLSADMTLKVISRFEGSKCMG